MDQIDVKDEYEGDKMLDFDVVYPPQCTTCLSLGRRLRPLGECTHIYLKLTSDAIQSSPFTDQLLICWECRAVLQRAIKFKTMAIRSNELMQLGRNYACGTLSNLKIAYTTVCKDINYETVEEQIDTRTTGDLQDDLQQNETSPETMKSRLHKTIHSEIPQTDEKHLKIEQELPEFKFDYGDDYIENDEVCPEIKTELDEEYKPDIDLDSVLKKKSQSSWYRKKAVENRKRKYRICINEDIKCEKKEYFRVKISHEELLECREKEKRSKFYKERKHKCSKCVQTFRNKISYDNHKKKKHENGGDFKCDICSMKFYTKNAMSSHLREHYYTLHCRLCEFTCLARAQIYSHVLHGHKTQLECVQCAQRFSYREEFHKHYKRCHETFTCDYCGKTFKLKYCIKKHIRKMHTEYECKDCNRTYVGLYKLNKHKKSKHAPRLPGYCVECDKQFVDVFKYRWHLKTSSKHRTTKKESTPCPSCDKVFSKKVYMTQHYNFVHLKNFKYRCEECDRNFLRNSALVVHRRKVHEGIQPPRNKICYMCGRGFTCNKVLQNHMRTHTGERPFSCSQCTASFSQISALVSHTRTLHRRKISYSVQGHL